MSLLAQLLVRERALKDATASVLSKTNVFNDLRGATDLNSVANDDELKCFFF
jgi:hypothetical protein